MDNPFTMIIGAGTMITGVTSQRLIKWNGLIAANVVVLVKLKRMTNWVECTACNGDGGFDLDDPDYDWEVCQECFGIGYINEEDDD